MSIVIEDGNGKGFTAGVTKNNRVQVSGINLTLTEAATESGDTYNINSSAITLTTSGESGILYLKNNENRNLIIDNIIINIKDYVGTDGQPTLKIYKKPTAGTLISAATTGSQSNRNYGSSKTLDITNYEGVEGSTITASDSSLEVYLPSTALGTLISFSTIIVLPKGSSVAVSYTPPSGITSVDIVAAFNATLNEDQL